MGQLLAFLLGLPPALVLTAALVLPAVEASTLVGLVVPGETAVFVAGLTAHHGQLPLWAVAVAASLGAVIGDQIGFTVGRRWGPGLRDHLPRPLRGSARLDRAAALVQRRGGWAVLLGRWTALLRALVPGLAGASGLRRRTFAIANLIGGSTWAIVVAVLGYEAGTAYQQVIDTMGRAGQLAFAAVIAAGLVAVVVHRLGQRRRDTMVPSGRRAPRPVERSSSS